MRCLKFVAQSLVLKLTFLPFLLIFVHCQQHSVSSNDVRMGSKLLEQYDLTQPRRFRQLTAGGLSTVLMDGEFVGNCTDDLTILKLINTTYDKNKVPGNKGVTDMVELWVQDMTTISDITSDFSLDIYISETWHDDGLHFTDYPKWCKLNMSLDAEMRTEIWMPNLCFINTKSAHMHSSPFLNFFLLLYPNGTVWANYRLKLTGPCAMNLTRFPFDLNNCSLMFNSFNYNNQEVRLKWAAKPRQLKPLNLADYELVDIETDVKHTLYLAGYWDEMICTFFFRRKYGWYLLQAYVPTYLTIFISWISFALGSKAIPARTMLGVNALLAMTFQFGNIIRNLPRVSYVKAIDVWMLSCMSFVFCSLIELAFVGYLMSRPKSARKSGRVSDKIGSLSVVSEISDFHEKSASTVRQSHFSDTEHLPTATTGDTTLSRRFPDSAPPTLPAPLLRDFEYDYRPPGLSQFVGSAAAGVTPQVDVAPTKFRACSCMCTANNVRHISADEDELDEKTVASSIGPVEKSHIVRPSGMSNYEIQSYRVDKASTFLFPFLFSLFNIYYWVHYLG